MSVGLGSLVANSFEKVWGKELRCNPQVCIVVYNSSTHLPKGKHMTYTTKMTMNELPEAVEAYAASGFDPEAMRPLMELLEKQTDYYQGRFWALADELDTIAEAYDLNLTWGQDTITRNR